MYFYFAKILTMFGKINLPPPVRLKLWETKLEGHCHAAVMFKVRYEKANENYDRWHFNAKMQNSIQSSVQIKTHPLPLCHHMPQAYRDPGVSESFLDGEAFPTKGENLLSKQAPFAGKSCWSQLFLKSVAFWLQRQLCPSPSLKASLV